MYVDPDPECDEDGWGEARSVAVAVTVATAAFGAYVLTYGLDEYLTYTDALGTHDSLLQFPVIVGILLAHEAVHALAYRVGCGLPWAAIETHLRIRPAGSIEPVQYSVHPGRPVRRTRYLAGVLAPGVCLGVVPVTVALATGSAIAMFVGLVGLLLVAGDVGTLVRLWRASTLATGRETPM